MRLMTRKSGILWGVQGVLAAAGLVIIMTGATVITLIGGDVAPAAVPFVVGLLAAVIAYGRWPASRPTVPSLAALQRVTS